MATAVESNKAKIARRMVEVLDYFDDEHPEATVMDIVRRYNRPQSSTSELLSSLVELGLLHKNHYTRSYSLTPRAAMLGAVAQPATIRCGVLNEIVDRLVAQTGLTVAVFGKVGLNVQIFSHKTGQRPIGTASSPRISRGLQDRLSNSAAGWLLLSTVAQPQRDGIVRRLNAESPDSQKFSTIEMSQRLDSCSQSGTVHGAAGFDTAAESCCILLPGQPESQPLAIGFIYERGAQLDPATLVGCLRGAIERTFRPAEVEAPAIPMLFSVA
jgi:DNA-binding IclR family transcriptional regulator